MTRLRAAAWLLSAGAALSARGGDLAPGAAPPTGIVPLRGETRLVVERVVGEIRLVRGRAGEIRYTSTTLGRRPLPLELSLSRERAAIRLAPASAAAGLPALLQIEIPEGVLTVLKVSDSKVALSGVEAPVGVEGSRLTVSAEGIRGDLELALEESKVELRELGGSVDVRGAGIDLTASGTGAVSLSLAGGRAALSDVRGSLQADLDSVELRVDEVAGPAVLRAGGGSVEAAGLRDDSVLTLRRAPLTVRDTSGDVDVTTDAAVTFSNLLGPFHVDSYGGSVVGKGARNLLEVRCQATTVEISDVAGPARVQGDGLTLRLRDIAGEAVVYVGASDVRIEGARGPLSVESESGSLAVLRARGAVEIMSRKDDVSLEGLEGTLWLDAEGPEVRVGWASFPQGGESLVKNGGGGAVVTLPSRGGGLVEARAAIGSVESEVPGVVVDGTGSAASGAVGGGGAGVVRIVARGDIRLLRAVPRPRPRLDRPVPAPRASSGP